MVAGPVGGCYSITRHSGLSSGAASAACFSCPTAGNTSNRGTCQSHAARGPHSPRTPVREVDFQAERAAAAVRRFNRRGVGSVPPKISESVIMTSLASCQRKPLLRWPSSRMALAPRFFLLVDRWRVQRTHWRGVALPDFVKNAGVPLIVAETWKNSLAQATMNLREEYAREVSAICDRAGQGVNEWPERSRLDIVSCSFRSNDTGLTIGSPVVASRGSEKRRTVCPGAGYLFFRLLPMEYRTGLRQRPGRRRAGLVLAAPQSGQEQKSLASR